MALSEVADDSLPRASALLAVDRALNPMAVESSSCASAVAPIAVEASPFAEAIEPRASDNSPPDSVRLPIATEPVPEAVEARKASGTVRRP